MNFKIGDRITWQSHGGHSAKVKTGEVVYVVPPSCDPLMIRKNEVPLSKDYYLRFNGFKRKGESYLVAIENAEFPNRKPDLHWPKVGALRPAHVPKMGTEWRLVCTSCGRDIGVPDRFPRDLEDGEFEEGETVRLLAPCEICGCRLFTLTLRPRSLMRVSTPVVSHVRRDKND